MKKPRAKKKPAKPERLSDLTPEERRQAIEGVNREEFFRRLQNIEKWRKERLASNGQDSR